MRKTRRNAKRHVIAVVLAMLSLGCNHVRQNVTFPGKPRHEYYVGHATEIDFPIVESISSDEVINTLEPHTIRDRDKQPLRDLHLVEAIQAALQHSEIIRTDSNFETTGSSLLAAGNNANSVYDPSIQESGVLFGGRGVEAALSAFDAQFRTSMVWARNEQVQNNIFFAGGLAPGTTLTTETAAFNASLAKSFAHGGTVTLNHVVNYNGSSAPGQLFPSTYTGNVGVNYQLPLLAGSGAEFTRIAGPISQQFGGLSGVSQGIMIARINNDITIADFEAAVRDLVKNVEDTYWDLYLAYRNYHTLVTAYEAALVTWRIADLQYEGEVRTRAEVAQARDQLFATQEAADSAQSRIFTMETKLRRLMGLPVSDGCILRPIDEPVSAELIPDFYASLTTALFQRVELRKQKWNIKSLELQLRAAENLVRPRLDFVGGYQVNGFGDDLLAYNQPRLDNYYDSIATGNQTGWNLGLQMQWDIGLRSAHAQVRNYELRIAKAYKVLAEQEKDINHELAVALQEVARSYRAAETNMNRLLAARENVKFLEPNIREGDKLLDDLLRAQDRQAQAEIAYYQSLVAYNKALSTLEYRKGTLLDQNHIVLAEGGWEDPAYDDAIYHYKSRKYANDNNQVLPVPEVIASEAPVGGVFFPNHHPTTASEPYPIESLPTELPPAADDTEARPMDPQETEAEVSLPASE